MKKPISQREAMRNRRELRRLREFVDRISGTYGKQDQLVALVHCPEVWVREKMRGMEWGAKGQVVFLASCERDTDKVTISVVRVPEAR